MSWVRVRLTVVQKYLPLAVDVMLRKPNEHISLLSHRERALVTKIISNVNWLCKLNKKQVVEFLKTSPSYQPILGQFYFEQGLNDWRLITNDMQPTRTAIPANVLSKDQQCVGVDYRIQFTLSSIGQKKGVRAVILMIFLMKDGSILRMYFNLKEFQKFRYQMAEVVRSIHSIEMKALY